MADDDYEGGAAAGSVDPLPTRFSKEVMVDKAAAVAAAVAAAEGSKATLAMDDQGGAAAEPHFRERIREVIQWLLQWPFILHAALVLSFVWIMSLIGLNYLLIYVLGYIFLFLVESRHHEKLIRKIRHQARKHAAQKQLLSDFESVRWLNETLEKAWPVFLQRFASQDFLAPLMPFFIGKYKPWTVQDCVLQSFNLGSKPPFIAGLRAVKSSSTDDDMVLEATMEFLAADDMSAVLAVQLKKRLGGIWTKLHISKLHVEGKVRIGVRFLPGWPFISRLRISFETSPYLLIEARPLTNYGMDVAELPGIASWLDTMLMDALEDSVVKPNMLVINVEKIASTWSSSEFTDHPPADTPPLATAVVEILEASQLKPADMNGLSDPFVKISLNTRRFKTSIKWKTLNPKWREVFRFPVKRWDIQNRVMFQVRDKDRFRDDHLGYCDVLLAKFRDGNRHEVCLPLKGVKTGRLTFAITVEEEAPQSNPAEPNQTEEEMLPDVEESSSSPSFADALGPDQYEIIDTAAAASGIFSILRPGKAVRKRWRGRKGRKADGKSDDNNAMNLPENKLFSGSLEGSGAAAAAAAANCDQNSDSEEDDDKVGKSGSRKRFWKWSYRGPKDDSKLSGELVSVSDSGAQIVLRTVSESDSTAAAAGLERDQGAGAIGIKQSSLNKQLTSDQDEEAAAIAAAAAAAATDQRSDRSVRPDSSSLDEGSEELVSPGRRSMRERAKSVVKQAEKTATHIGHSLWRKRSHKDLASP